MSPILFRKDLKEGEGQVLIVERGDYCGKWKEGVLTN